MVAKLTPQHLTKAWTSISTIIPTEEVAAQRPRPVSTTLAQSQRSIRTSPPPSPTPRYLLPHPNNPPAVQTLDEMEWERGLWGAAMNGNLTKCRALLSKGSALPNDRDSAGYTALHYAARGGKLDVCQLLVKHGADVNAKTCQGLATPLHRAAYMGHDAVCAFLLEHGAGVPMQRLQHTCITRDTPVWGMRDMFSRCQSSMMMA